MTDTRIKDGLHTILDTWTIIDLYEAHAVLNALDAAEHRANQSSKDR